MEEKIGTTKAPCCGRRVLSSTLDLYWFPGEEGINFDVLCPQCAAGREKVVIDYCKILEKLIPTLEQCLAYEMKRKGIMRDIPKILSLRKSIRTYKRRLKKEIEDGRTTGR